MRFLIVEKEDSKVYVDETRKIEFAIEKNVDGIRTITVNDSYIEGMDDSEIYKLLGTFYENAAKDGVKLKIESTKSLSLDKNQLQETLVKDIEPIKFDGEIDITDDMTLFMCIEPPVRKACMMLKNMGINTLMSSANKVDVESRNTRIKGFENRGNGEHFNLGNGYAWIMIDWETLSQDNKQKIIMLNNGTIPIELSDKEKENLVHNCEINNFTPSQKELVSFFQIISVRLLYIGDRSSLKLVADSNEDNYYEQNRRGYVCNNSLCNHGDNYRTVVIRYPLDENTTVSQVDNYFTGIIKHLSIQKKQINQADSAKMSI